MSKITLDNEFKIYFVFIYKTIRSFNDFICIYFPVVCAIVLKFRIKLYLNVWKLINSYLIILCRYISKWFLIFRYWNYTVSLERVKVFAQELFVIFLGGWKCSIFSFLKYHWMIYISNPVISNNCLYLNLHAYLLRYYLHLNIVVKRISLLFSMDL